MVEELTDPLPLERLLFVDLGENEKRLFARVHRIHAGCKVLRFMYQNANAHLTAEDIAFQVKEPLSVVTGSLQALVELGLVSQMSIAGWVFFGLVVESGPREQVRAVFAWQDRWHTHLARMGQVVDGDFPGGE